MWWEVTHVMSVIYDVIGHLRKGAVTWDVTCAGLWVGSLSEGYQRAFRGSLDTLTQVTWYDVMVTCTRSRGLQKGCENTRDILKNHVTCNTSFKMCDVACHMTRVLRVCSQVTSICWSRDCMSGSRGKGPPIRVGWRVVTWCVTWLNHVTHVTNGGLWLAASPLVGYIHDFYITNIIL